MLTLPILLTTTPPMRQIRRMVTEASPNSRIVRAGRERPLVSVFRVYDGDVLKTPAGGAITVVFKESGKRWKTAGLGKVLVEATTVRRLSGPAPRLLSPLPPAYRGILDGPGWDRSGGITVRAGVSVPDDVGPRDLWPSGIVVAPPAEFRWSGKVPGERVRIRIRDVGSLKVDLDAAADAGKRAVPARLLSPGKSYVWSAEADDGTMAETRFRIATPVERRSIEALRRAERDAAGSTDAGPLVIVGSGYESFGLYEDARRVYARLARLRPGDAGIQSALERADRGARGGAVVED